MDDQSRRTELTHLCLSSLKRWELYARDAWTWLSASELAERSGQASAPRPIATGIGGADAVAGYYGTGYASWGVMAHAAAVVTSAVTAWATADRDCGERALKGLRFLMGSHTAGPLRLVDGEKWGSGLSGHNDQYSPSWVALGMLVCDLMVGDLTAYDKSLTRAILLSEVNHHLGLPVDGGQTSSTGHFDGYAWRAALLTRAAISYPDKPRVWHWRQRATLLWWNSLPRQGDSGNLGGGSGYDQLGGLMAPLLARTLTWLMYRRRGGEGPEDMRRWREAVALLGDLCLWDGSLVSMGGRAEPPLPGDQALLLPVLAWTCSSGMSAISPQQATWALAAAFAVLEGVTVEQDENGDGSFLSRRLERLRERSELEYYRYEAGVALALAITYVVLAHAPSDDGRAIAPASVPSSHWERGKAAVVNKNSSSGSIWRRGKECFVGWSWLTQPESVQRIVVPRWACRFGQERVDTGSVVQLKEHRSGHMVQYHREYESSRGWATVGLLAEAMPDWAMVERTPSLRHGLAFWALPDERTCVLMELVWTERSVTVVERRGLLYRLANDLPNGNHRRIGWQHGERLLQGRGAEGGVWRPDTEWLVLDDCLFVMPLWGGELAIETKDAALLGLGRHTDETTSWIDICAPLERGARRIRAASTVIDMAAVYVCAENGQAGEAINLALAPRRGLLQADVLTDPRARALYLTALDGSRYVMAANMDRVSVYLHLPAQQSVEQLVGNARILPDRVEVPPASLTLCLVIGDDH